MKHIEKRFDAIVVGAGPAGATAAYQLAKMGYKTLLLERGRTPGSKSMFGGRVYIRPLKDIYEDFEKKAPIHRWVKKERISLVYDESATTIEYTSNKTTSFTTYLTQLSHWMANQAVEQGAILLTEIRVDRLYKEDGRYRGVVVEDEVVKSDVVIDAEGINRLLLEREGIVEKLSPDHVALGVKEVIKLEPDTINNLFGLDNNEGLSWILMGDVTDGIPGGAFIYTNRDSVSLGIVVLLGEAAKRIDRHIYILVEELRNHPLLYKYFKDGRIMEYSTHLIPEDPSRLMPKKLYYDGLMIVGDAAGLLLNQGYTYRGVDFAAYSGYIAAKAYEKAHGNGGVSEENLRVYQKMLEDSFVMKMLRKFSSVSRLMKKERLFSTYPQLINLLASKLMHIEYDSYKLKEAFDEARKGRVGLINIIKDLWEVSRKL